MKIKITKIVTTSLLLVAGLAVANIANAQSSNVVQIKKRNAQSFAIDGNGGAANGQNVYLWSENQNNVNQQWIEINRGGRYYSYRKQGTNHCIDGGAGGADRQDVYLWDCRDNNQNQHWEKVSTGSGFFQLRKRNASGFALNGGNRGTNGQNINLFDSSASSENLQWSITTVGSDGGGSSVPDNSVGNCNRVDSLSEFKEYLSRSNQCVQMSPGTYTFDANNTGTGRLFSDPAILRFTGSNNTFIFDNVTFQFDTEIFTTFGREEVNEFHVIGRNNTFRNLTMADLGDTDPSFRVQALILDGADNTVEGFDITTRGSFPYGYGDIFGKGAERVIGLRKHSGILIRGDSITLKDTRLLMRSYGHGIFMQGAQDTVIDGCHVEGELRTVSAVLDEEGTGSPADGVDFRTVWGFNLRDLDNNYRFSLQEDGIRAYPRGRAEGLGLDEERSTGDITVLNSTVKFMRSGVTLGLSRSDKYVENVTALGTESGFWVGDNGRVVNSRGDTSVGPLYSEDVRRNGSIVDLTIVDNEVRKIGNTPAFYLAGSNHDITLKDGTSSVLSGVSVQVGGTRSGHRWYDGSDDEPLPNFSADGLTIDNQTPYGLLLESNSSNITGSSCGPIRRDNGSRNSVRRECN